MRSIRRILVAIKDPTARSLPAVAKAAQLARALGARLELFHALDEPVYVEVIVPGGDGFERFQNTRRKQALKYLEKIAARIRGRRLQVTTAAEWDFPGYESIVRRAEQIGADLIVAERHVGRHVAPWLLHMTDWELLRLSPVPVLLVKSSRPYRNPIVLAAVDPTHEFAKPAKLDEAILRLASGVKSALRGSLHVVHAYVPALNLVPPEHWSRSDITAEIQAKAAAKARQSLERVLRASRITRSHRHLIPHHPIEAIREAARKARAQIVVMGAISRSGLKGLFIGNTAERVLDELTCDLLVVKPARFVSHVRRAVRGPRLASATPPP